jgi:hypothetical protein
MKKTLFAALIIAAQVASAQTGPEITSWIQNTSGATGYGGIQSNCQLVQYSASNVYVSCTCIPGYSIGPWNGLPGTQVPVNENFVYKITRTPQQNTGTPVSIGGGHIGVWSNGVSIFNAQDAYSWNNQNIWHRDAVYFEGSTFDSCLGHPSPFGEYHTHLNPRCLYNPADSLNHSPIIGYSFDGYPVYGAYGYANTDGTGGIKRMKSSYSKRNITVRDTLPDGTALTSPQYGPAVSSSYPVGYFLEDYKYVAGAGDLDAHNGRFCVTPDYPSGTYAYFVTIDASLQAVFPYVIYGTYYGVVPQGNTGPNGGHNTVSESTTVYTTGINEIKKEILFEFYPNPAKDYGYVYIDPASRNNLKMYLYNSLGEKILNYDAVQPSISYTLDFTKLRSGAYYLHLVSEDGQEVQKQKIMIIK